MKERGPSAEEEAKKFVKNSSNFLNVDEEYDGTAKKRQKKSTGQDEFERKEMIDEDEPCSNCVIHCKPHLLLFYNDRMYVSAPDRTPLVSRQITIRPTAHAQSLLLAPEDVVSDVYQARQIIASMFSPSYHTLFVETYFRSQRRQLHFQIQCYPVPSRYADQLKMSFKKSILECEHEWSVNKKLVTIDRSVTRCVSNLKFKT